MSVPAITRVAVVALTLAVAGVPVARRLCGLSCESVASSSESSRAPRHCPAHPAPALPSAPESPPNPCGHGHGGDGAVVTASSSLAKTGARTAEAPAPLPAAASESGILSPCGGTAGFDRRPTVPPPAARHPVLRL